MQQLVRVVTNRRRLETLHGEGYFDKLAQAIVSWKNALAAENWSVEEALVLCDDLPNHNVPLALKERLARLNRRPADAVMILGGPEVVPFFPIRSSGFLIPTDGDAEILSDDPYAAFDRHNVLYKPECAVGRLPDGGPHHTELLLDLLARSTLHHRAPSPSVSTPIGVASAVWQNTSRQIFGCATDWFTCPPNCLSARLCGNGHNLSQRLQSCNLQYYNVRGTRANTLWYGQCNFDECRQCSDPHVPFLDAQTIPPLPGAWVLCEASYSAWLNTEADNTLAAQFMKQGAVCYIGATAATYCSTTPVVLSAADQIAKTLMDSLQQNMHGHTQLSIGEILKRAKLGYAVQDNFDRKTRVEFVLLGDPTLVPFRREG